MSISRRIHICRDLRCPTRDSMGSTTSIRSRLAGLLLATLAQPALAQTQAGASTEETEKSREIVVTARKQEEPAISAPVSVSLFDADEIQKRQADSLEPLARLAPNVSYESGANIAGGGRTYTVFMRGVGQNDFLLTIDPGVGLYVDGVYVSRTVGGLIDTFDVASIQVLRGPQGTFFGKNTIGGAFLVDTARPTQELEARARLTLGSFERIELGGVANLPLSSSVALRVEANSERQQGYVERVIDGGRMGGSRSISGRIALAAQLSPAIEMILRFDGLHARDTGAPATMLAATNQIIVPDPQAPPNFGFFYNLTQANGTCGVPPLPPVPAIRNCFGPHFLTGDPRKTSAGGPNYSRIDQWGTSLTLDAELGPVRLRSITAYRKMRGAFYLDTDASPLTVSETQNDYRYSQFSQELSASSDISKGADLIAGLYYLGESGSDENELRFSIADFASGGLTDNESIAAFGHLNVDLGSNITLSAGARYSHERKSFKPDQFIRLDRTGGTLIGLSQFLIPPALNPDGRRILPPVRSRHRIDQFTPTISLSFAPSDNATLYVSYSEGFKAGGFTQRIFPPEAVTPDFGPEKVQNYEAGAKFSLPRRIGALNLAGFYSDYTDMQLIINAGLSPKVKNAGKARILGGELELAIAPTKGFELRGAVGYISPKYLEVSPAAFPVSLASRLPNAPSWTLSVAADASLIERDDFVVSAHTDWAYKSSHFKDANNSPQLFQPGYGLLNANLAIDLPGPQLNLALGATNIGNVTYLVSGYSELAIQAAAYGVFGPPRRFYVRFQKRF